MKRIHTFHQLVIHISVSDGSLVVSDHAVLEKAHQIHPKSVLAPKALTKLSPWAEYEQKTLVPSARSEA